MSKILQHILEFYRNKEGIIELRSIPDGLELIKIDTEELGNGATPKNWLNVKGSANDRGIIKWGKNTISHNAICELIYTEVIKYYNIECFEKIEIANVDLIKYQDTYGLISYDVCDPGEVLITLNEHLRALKNSGAFNEQLKILIKSDDDNVEHYKVPFLSLGGRSFYNYITNEEIHGLARLGLSSDFSEKLILGINKIELIDLFLHNTDRHPGNLAFIKTSAGTYKMSPLFDNDSSLGVDQYIHTIHNEERMKEIEVNSATYDTRKILLSETKDFDDIYKKIDYSLLEKSMHQTYMSLRDEEFRKLINADYKYVEVLNQLLKVSPQKVLRNIIIKYPYLKKHQFVLRLAYYLLEYSGIRIKNILRDFSSCMR
jgi:hypothetical protein